MPATATAGDQRTHILDTALALMSVRGVPDTSMRHLAEACGLNVATLYHYFPSKEAIVHAVIEDRRYLDRLAVDVPTVDPSTTPRQRIEAILRFLWRATQAEGALVKLMLSECLRADPLGMDTVAQLMDAMDAGFERWLHDLVPELDMDPAVAARIIRSQLIGWLIEGLALLPAGREPEFDRRAAELAAVLAPG